MRKSFTSGTRLSLALSGWRCCCSPAGPSVANSADWRPAQVHAPGADPCAETADRGTRRRPGLAPAAGRSCPAAMRKRSPHSRTHCATSSTRNRMFKLIANGGESAADAIPAQLRPYRYLLSSTLDTQAFDRKFLAEELAQRVQDLGSPASGPDRAVVAQRSHAGNAQAGRILATRECPAAAAWRVVRSQGTRGAAGDGDARGGL